MTNLYCPDGERAEFPPPQPPAPKERGAKWTPPDTTRDKCLRCGRQCWQHWTISPQPTGQHEGMAGWRAGIEASIRHLRAMQAKPRDLYHPAFFAALEDLEVSLLAMLERGTERATTDVANWPGPEATLP